MREKILFVGLNIFIFVFLKSDRVWLIDDVGGSGRGLI